VWEERNSERGLSSQGKSVAVQEKEKSGAYLAVPDKRIPETGRLLKKTGKRLARRVKRQEKGISQKTP